MTNATKLSDEQFDAILSELDTQLKDRPPAQPKAAEEIGIDHNLIDQAMDLGARSLEGAHDLWKSVGAGMGDAVLETKDFLVGEPAEEDKSEFRKEWEERSEELASRSPIHSIVNDIAQFTTGMLGVGKLLAPIKAVQKLKTAGKVGRTAYEIGRGAVTGSVVIDPHEERLSNLIQQYEILQNPVTEYLAADPDDSAPEGRLKNALEGIGMDLAIAGAFALSIKAVRHFRAGDTKAAVKSLKEAEKISVRETPQGVAVDPTTVEMPKAQQLEVKAVQDSEPRARMPSAQTLEVDAVDDVQMPKTQQLEVGEAVPQAELTDADLSEIVKSSGDDVPSEAQGGPSTAPSSQSGGMTPADEIASEAAPRVNQTPLALREVSDDEVKALMVESRKQDDILRSFGGDRQAAISAGELKARADGLPWQKLTVDGGLSSFIEQSTRVLSEATPGNLRITDAEVTRLVNRRAALFNEDPALVIGDLTKAGESARELVVQMETGYRLFNKAASETHDLANRIHLGFVDDPAAALVELKQRLAVVSRLGQDAKSLSSAAGRTLRRTRRDFQISPDDLDALNALDGETLVELIRRTDGDPKRMLTASKGAFWRRAIDRGAFYYSNNLLWGWPTHVVNTTSNVLMLGLRPTEKLLGGVAQSMRGKDGGGTLVKQAALEYRYTVSSLMDGFTAMSEAFMRGDSRLSPFQKAEFFEEGSLGQNFQADLRQVIKPGSDLWSIMGNAGRIANVALGLPTRSLGAIDEHMKTMRYRAYVQAKASLEADAQGLTREAYSMHVNRRMVEAIDEVTGEALDPKALMEAQVSTFQQELLPDTLGRSAQAFRANHPSTKLLLPFLKTPVNVFRYSIKMTPGLNLLQSEFRKMIRGELGVEAQAHAYGQMALGTLAFGIAGVMAANGKVTGSGPQDDQTKRKLMEGGWRPNSYVVENDDGTKTYIPINRADPVGMVMGMAADAIMIDQLTGREGDSEEVFGPIFTAILGHVTDRTFLRSFHGAVTALNDPSGRGTRFLGQMVGNTVPGASGLKFMTADDRLTDARGILDNAIKNVPGASLTVPSRRDVFGEPVLKQLGLVAKDDSNDPVEAEHQRILLVTGKGLGHPSPRLGDTDLRDITLTDGRNAFDVLQEYMRKIPGQKVSLKDTLRKVIDHPNYPNFPDGAPDLRGTKSWALARATSRYRKAAKAKFLSDYPDMAELSVERLKEAMKQYQGNVRRQKNKGDVDRLFDSLGGQ